MKNVTKTNVLFAVTVLVYIILTHGIGLLYSAPWFPKYIVSYNFLLILPELILLTPAIFYVAVVKKEPVESYGVSKVSMGTNIATVFMAFCIIPLVSLINMLSSFFVDNYVDNTLTTIVNENSVIINLIIIALIPAIVEEFIFRGVIFNSYKKRNPFGAVLLSAFLFGLVHMNVNQFSYAFVIGVIFALLTYATGSIIPSIIAHFVINGNSVVMSHLLTYIQKGTQAVTETGSAMTPVDKLNEEYGMLSEAVVYAVVIGTLVVMSIIGCLVAFFIFRYICKKNRGIESVKMIFKKNVRNTYVEEEGKFFDEYLWLGIGVCLVYIILYDFIL